MPSLRGTLKRVDSRGKVGHQAVRLEIVPQGQHRVRTWRRSDGAQVTTTSCPPRFSGRLKCPNLQPCQHWDQAQPLRRALCLWHNPSVQLQQELRRREPSVDGKTCHSRQHELQVCLIMWRRPRSPRVCTVHVCYGRSLLTTAVHSQKMCEELYCSRRAMELSQAREY